MANTKQRKILPVWLYFLIYGAVIVLCVGLDQLTKWWVFNLTHAEPLSARGSDNWWTASGDQNVKILGSWLQFRWITNDGATGGLFSGMKGSNWLFFFMTLVGLPAFGWLLWRSRTRSVWGQIAFSFVIGGTLGNAIDRLFLAQNGFFTGEVRDFVQVEHFFGIFNVADSFLVVGVIMALLAIVFFDRDSLWKSFVSEKKGQTATEPAVNSETPQSDHDGAEQPQPNDEPSEEKAEATDENN